MNMKRTTFTFYALVLFLGLGGFLGCRQLDGSSRTGNYSIKGTVLDKDNKPLSGVVISVMGGGIGSVETDSSGNYELSGLGKNTCQVIAKKASYIFVPDFKSSGSLNYGSGLNVGSSAVNGVVSGVDFIAIPAGSLTISDIQGSGAKSPLTGETVYGITGVVTMISNKAANWNYNNSNVEGEDIAQYVGNDGFYLEALPYDKDFTGTKSNAIFVNTHDESFTDSKWKSGIPTDLQAGDVVTVSGVVAESRILDRFGSSTATLSRTEINAETVIRVQENGKYKTAPYPDGILITYSQAKADQWKEQRKYTWDDGKGGTKEYPGEARVMVGDVDSAAPMDEAIKVLETMECSVIYIDNPLVIAGTYYNTTGVLADGGYKEDGTRFRTFNETWMTNVVDKNDYNEELLFVDYSAFDFSAYRQSLAQTGDTLVDSTGAKVFRGVMDYITGIYIARPLNSEDAMYVQSTAANFITSYYTTYTGSTRTLTTYSGRTVPDQANKNGSSSSTKWRFDGSASWYTKLDNSAFGTVSKTNVTSGMQSQANTSNTSANGITVRQWRTGTSANTFNAGSVFTPNWTSESSTSTGNTNEKSLTVGAFNLENYEAQGSTYEKCQQVALTIKNNMLYPDVVVIVEMGDDAKTSSLYTNQDNEYAPRDGIVTAVRNFSTISDAIVANGGPRYEFRCIDPKERDSGGKSGVNIRNGFLYNTQRVEFVDNGLVSNTYANTHDSSNNLLDESEWPVQTKDNDPAGWALADARTYPFKGEDGKPHLSQSPAYIESSYFARSRRPLIGEFKIKDSSGNTTEENFFVVACHLSSKRGDYPLYGSVQPPLLLSEVKRNGQAATINKFVQEILDIDEDAKIVVAGDMNDFAYSNPMQVLTGAVNRNQILYSLTEEFMPKNERFSYVYNGNYQQIDHVYVSKSLYDKALAEVGGKEAAQTSGDWKKVCFIPHIDSMFTRNNHYNLSDHDPDLIRIPGVFQ